MDITSEYITQLVTTERTRQEALKQSGKFEHTAADAACDDVTRLSMLVEEVGEVARGMQEKDLKNTFEELIQVAAIAQAWAQHLAGNLRVLENYE